MQGKMGFTVNNTMIILQNDKALKGLKIIATFNIYCLLLFDKLNLKT